MYWTTLYVNSTNNVNKTRALPRTTGGKQEPKSGNRNVKTHNRTTRMSSCLRLESFTIARTDKNGIMRYGSLLIGKFDISPLISMRDIFSINGLTLDNTEKYRSV